jgi:exopolyphosphatase/guanosine-5'-triphosphate,3'-diphosphate pyrophosphatase
VIRLRDADNGARATYAFIMRLAAIDVGSNSVHMVIADVRRDGHFEVIDRVKEMVRLGRNTFTSGRLAREPMELAVRALKNFARLAKVRRVDRIRAVATSAVREAQNGEAFIARIRRETGLRVQIISGAEEAQFIFNAARHALGLEGGPYLLIDVGGGSVELVLVRDGEALWMESLPLGVARLTERFLTSDPPDPAEVRRLEDHLHRKLDALLRKARRAEVVRAIGTSGTINALVAMARVARDGEQDRLHGLSIPATDVTWLRNRLLKLSADERAELPGADPKRADLMPAAAVLADFVLEHAGAPELVACTWALREGILLSMVNASARGRGTIEARRRSVSALARRFGALNGHGPQVARLALKIFDAAAPALKAGPQARELLEHAALLHDIGRVIDHDRHNRHTYYLVKNAELLGFDPLEIEIIAQAARGHRKPSARLDSPEFRALSPAKRHLVRSIAAVLRLADALDRSHFSVVKDIRIRRSPDRFTITVDAAGGQADLELWTCERRSDLLSRLLSRQVTVRRQAQRATVRPRRATVRPRRAVAGDGR